MQHRKKESSFVNSVVSTPRKVPGHPVLEENPAVRIELVLTPFTEVVVIASVTAALYLLVFLPTFINVVIRPRKKYVVVPSTNQLAKSILLSQTSTQKKKAQLLLLLLELRLQLLLLLVPLLLLLLLLLIVPAEKIIKTWSLLKSYLEPVSVDVMFKETDVVFVTNTLSNLPITMPNPNSDPLHNSNPITVIVVFVNSTPFLTVCRMV